MSSSKNGLKIGHILEVMNYIDDEYKNGVRIGVIFIM